MAAGLPTSIALRTVTPRGAEDVVVDLVDATVTLAEVVHALGLGPDVRLDGERVSQSQLDGPATLTLGDGAVIGGLEAGPVAAAVPQPAATAGSGVPVVEVSVVAGLDAGASTQLPVGRYRIGRPGAGADAEWLLAVDRMDLASATARPWHEVGPTVETVAGASSVIALGRPVDPLSRTRGFVHRPPRPLPAAGVEPIRLEEAPKPLNDPPALSWATILAPIPIAVLMAVFFRPLFALFAAMGPLVAIGRWIEGRRRHRRDRERRETEIARIRSELVAARRQRAEQEARRRWHHHPHVAALARRAGERSARLWERRPAGPSYLQVAVGVASDELQPEVDGARPDPEVHAGSGDPIPMRPVPHVVDLSTGTGVGVTGDRASALAVARALLLQLATLHGPADLRLGVVAPAARASEWDWLKWLPHLDDRLVTTSTHSIVGHLGSLRVGPPTTQAADEIGAVLLLLVDDPSADVASIHRAACEAGVTIRTLAIADEAIQLPAVCTAIVDVQPPRGLLSTPNLVDGRVELIPVGVSSSTADRWARQLAPMRDPELLETSSAGDEVAGLFGLFESVEPSAIAAGWSARPPDTPPTATVGVGPEGPYSIDLISDGPHALVAGTTGSGKSEFLRTLIVSLAAECPPDHLNFVLVDFKGGGAFDVCQRLPHVAGLITDLDEGLVARALSSLRAELHRRETLFRSLAVSTYEEAVRASDRPIARLVVVIDEFAALATDHGELLTSIIDLAARGRSLGMHLVLATQRPSGVVDQKIRANTNLRIALRVQDPFDSQDVIGTPDAAAIDRKAPGRALFSVGGDRPVAVQTAWSGAPDRRRRRCCVRLHRLSIAPSGPGRPEPSPPAEVTELQVLLSAIESAADRRGQAARPLWPDPLPESLDWIDLGARVLADSDGQNDGLPLGLVDLPDQQVQRPWRWNPDRGSLLLYGASAATAGRFLVSVAASIATTSTSDDAHLYVLDGDGGTTSPLLGLPHTGAYVTGDEPDRLDRTVALIERALATRRTSNGDGEPRVVVLIDNLAALLAGVDDVAAMAITERLAAIARDGTPRGIHLVITARAPRDVSHRLAQQIPHRIVAELADPSGYLTLGLSSRDVVPLPRMRAVDLGTRRLLQLVEPPDLGDVTATARGGGAGRVPEPVRTFPTSFMAAELPPARVDGDVLVVPVGVDAVNVRPCELRLVPGEHALVVGTPGSGRSSCLRAIAEQLMRSDIEVDIVWLTPPAAASEDDVRPGRELSDPDAIGALATVQQRTVVLVDDVHRLPEEVGATIDPLSRSVNPHLALVVASAPDHVRGLRSSIGHIRASGTGIILGGSAADGDLLKVKLGRLDGLGQLAGRGHLVTRGSVLPMQLARVGEAECATLGGVTTVTDSD